MTTIAVSADLLAVGYTSGTVLVYQLDDSDDMLKFEQVHQFSFHKSAVNCLLITDDGTQLVSGGADTYIIIYDLINSTAEYKLIGHSGAITHLQVVVTPHPQRHTVQRSLLSASVDGFIKVWDL